MHLLLDKPRGELPDLRAPVHVAPLAFEGVLAHPVEVELLLLVLDAAEANHVEAFSFDLDRVPVVEICPVDRS